MKAFIDRECLEEHRNTPSRRPVRTLCSDTELGKFVFYPGEDFLIWLNENCPNCASYALVILSFKSFDYHIYYWGISGVLFDFEHPADAMAFKFTFPEAALEP